MIVRLPTVITEKVGKKLAGFLSTPAPSHLPLSQYVTPVIELGDQNVFDDFAKYEWWGTNVGAGLASLVPVDVIAQNRVMLVYGLSFVATGSFITRVYLNFQSGGSHILWSDPATSVTPRMFGCANWYTPWVLGPNMNFFAYFSGGADISLQVFGRFVDVL